MSSDELIQERLALVERPVVFFHDGCVTHDGWFSAYLAKLRWPDAELVPVQYGDVPPWRISEGPKDPTSVTGRDVIVVDFSWDRVTLSDLRGRTRSLLVLDHHKTAARDLEGLDDCVFDMKRSGAGLALDHFFPGARDAARQGLCTPLGGIRRECVKDVWRYWPEGLEVNARVVWLAQIVEQYDLWDFSDPRTRAVGIYLETVKKHDFEAWKGEIYKHSINEMAEKGEPLLRYRAGLVDSLVRNAYRVRWPEGEVAVVNSALFRNEVADALRDSTDVAAVLVWYRHEDGGVVCSLRSRKGGLDCSAVAERFGGGGHPQSAGFRLDLHKVYGDLAGPEVIGI